MRKFLALLLTCAAAAAFAIPLAPVYQGSKTISCTGTSAATTLAGVAGQTQVELQNAGTVAVFVEFGDSNIAAAVATGYPVLAGQSKLVTVSSATTHIACIATSGTQTVYVTIGKGD